MSSTGVRSSSSSESMVSAGTKKQQQQQPPIPLDRLNMVSEGTVHFRREKHAFDLKQTPFPGGVKLRFRLPREHVSPSQVIAEQVTVIAEQSGFFGFAEIASRELKCIDRRRDEYSMKIYLRAAAEIRICMMRRKPGAPPVVPASQQLAVPASVAQQPAEQLPMAMDPYSTAAASNYGGHQNLTPAEQQIMQQNQDINATGTPKGYTLVGGGASSANANAVQSVSFAKGTKAGNSINAPQGPLPVPPNFNPLARTDGAGSNGNAPGGPGGPVGKQNFDPQNLTIAAQQGMNGVSTSSNQQQQGGSGTTSSFPPGNLRGNNQQGGSSSSTSKQLQPAMNSKNNEIVAQQQQQLQSLQDIPDRSNYEKFGEPSDLTWAYPSEKPQMPKIKRWWGFPTKVSVSWDVDGMNPEGAPIEDYQAQFSEAPNWSQLWNPEWRDIIIKSNRLIVTQLTPESVYWVRVRARNCIGAGEYCQPFEIATSTRGRIKALTQDESSFYGYKTNYLVVELQTLDPEGAPVERVKVEKANYFGPILSSWDELEPVETVQLEADVWRVGLPTLSVSSDLAGTPVRLRVSLYNAVGQSEFYYHDTEIPTKTDAVHLGRDEPGTSTDEDVSSAEETLTATGRSKTEEQSSFLEQTSSGVGMSDNFINFVKAMHVTRGQSKGDRQIRINLVAQPTATSVMLRCMFQAQQENLKVQRCKIEYGAGGNKWQRLELTPDLSNEKENASTSAGSFETQLESLVPSQTYRARVELIPTLKSKFSVPDATYLSCIGYSPVFPVFTSSVALAPWNLSVVEKSPTSVSILCTTNVPDGAEVTKIQVEQESGWSGWERVTKCAVQKYVQVNNNPQKDLNLNLDEAYEQDGNSITQVNPGSLDNNSQQQSLGEVVTPNSSSTSSSQDMLNNKGSNGNYPREFTKKQKQFLQDFSKGGGSSATSGDLNQNTSSSSKRGSRGGSSSSGQNQSKLTQLWKLQIYDLQPEQRYTFRLAAMNACGRSPWSRSVLASTSLPPKPCYNLEVVGTQGYGAKVRWTCDDPEGCPVTECQIQISEEGVFSKYFFAKGEDLQTREWKSVIQGLLPNRSYLFRVAPKNAVGLGPTAQCAAVFKTAPVPKRAQNLRGCANGCIRFEMQDLLRDAPVLGCMVEYRMVSKEKKKEKRFAYRNYKAEKSQDTGVFTTWELPNLPPGLYVISIRGFNCAGWGELAEANVAIKDTAGIVSAIQDTGSLSPEIARPNRRGGAAGGQGTSNQEVTTHKSMKEPVIRKRERKNQNFGGNSRDAELEFNVVGRKNLPPLFKGLRFSLNWFLMHEVRKGHDKFLSRNLVRSLVEDDLDDEAVTVEYEPRNRNVTGDSFSLHNMEPLQMQMATPAGTRSATFNNKERSPRNDGAGGGGPGGATSSSGPRHSAVESSGTSNQGYFPISAQSVVDNNLLPAFPQEIVTVTASNFHLLDANQEYVPRKSQRLEDLEQERLIRYNIANALNDGDDGLQNPEHWLVRFSDFMMKIYKKPRSTSSPKPKEKKKKNKTAASGTTAAAEQVNLQNPQGQNAATDLLDDTASVGAPPSEATTAGVSETTAVSSAVTDDVVAGSSRAGAETPKDPVSGGENNVNPSGTSATTSGGEPGVDAKNPGDVGVVEKSPAPQGSSSSSRAAAGPKFQHADDHDGNDKSSDDSDSTTQQGAVLKERFRHVATTSSITRNDGLLGAERKVKAERAETMAEFLSGTGDPSSGNIDTSPTSGTVVLGSNSKPGSKKTTTEAGNNATSVDGEQTSAATSPAANKQATPKSKAGTGAATGSTSTQSAPGGAATPKAKAAVAAVVTAGKIAGAAAQQPAQTSSEQASTNKEEDAAKKNQLTKKQLLAQSYTVRERVQALGLFYVLRSCIILLHDSLHWMERASLDHLWGAIFESLDGKMLADWQTRKEEWNEAWLQALQEHLPEVLRLCDHILHGVDLAFLLKERVDLLQCLRALGQGYLAQQKRLMSIRAVLLLGAQTAVNNAAAAAGQPSSNLHRKGSQLVLDKTTPATNKTYSTAVAKGVVSEKTNLSKQSSKELVGINTSNSETEQNNLLQLNTDLVSSGATTSVVPAIAVQRSPSAVVPEDQIMEYDDASNIIRANSSSGDGAGLAGLDSNGAHPVAGENGEQKSNRAVVRDRKNGNKQSDDENSDDGLSNPNVFSPRGDQILQNDPEDQTTAQEQGDANSSSPAQLQQEVKQQQLHANLSHIPGESFLGKVQHSVLGFAAGLVMPLPGALEVWAISNVMLWMSDDMRFLLLEDQTVESLRNRVCPVVETRIEQMNVVPIDMEKLRSDTFEDAVEEVTEDAATTTTSPAGKSKAAVANKSPEGEVALNTGSKQKNQQTAKRPPTSPEQQLVQVIERRGYCLTAPHTLVSRGLAQGSYDTGLDQMNGWHSEFESQISAYLHGTRRRVLICNQTCRCVTLRFESYDGIVQKTVGLVMSAHPMTKLVLGGITSASRMNSEEILLWPGQVLCLQVPFVASKENRNAYIAEKKAEIKALLAEREAERRLKKEQQLALQPPEVVQIVNTEITDVDANHFESSSRSGGPAHSKMNNPEETTAGVVPDEVADQNMVKSPSNTSSKQTANNNNESASKAVDDSAIRSPDNDLSPKNKSSKLTNNKATPSSSKQTDTHITPGGVVHHRNSVDSHDSEEKWSPAVEKSTDLLRDGQNSSRNDDGTENVDDPGTSLDYGAAGTTLDGGDEYGYGGLIHHSLDGDGLGLLGLDNEDDDNNSSHLSSPNTKSPTKQTADVEKDLNEMNQNLQNEQPTSKTDTETSNSPKNEEEKEQKLVIPEPEDDENYQPEEEEYLKCHLKFYLEKGVVATVDASRTSIHTLARLDCGISIHLGGPKDGIEVQNHGYIPVLVKLWLKSARMFDGAIYETGMDLYDTIFIENKNISPDEKLQLEIKEKVDKSLIHTARSEMIEIPASCGFVVKINGFV
ncbi:unnamed protein product [Amoebophrya sp. A120]|nr:unnamed protein product [Amoebophrya sp. A120]|eukprot:GSA120T00009289001.1